MFTRFLQGLEPGRPAAAEGIEEVWQTLRRLLVTELKRRKLWALSPACLGIYGSPSWADDEGMVLRSARNFLHETQKRHDPVGFRAFTVLRATVRATLESGALRVVAGNPSVRRGTVLAFVAGDPPDAADADRLAAVVHTWNEALLPDLITARGWEVRPLMARVEEHLLRLPLLGFSAFRFQDLVDPLRRDVRARWRARSTSRRRAARSRPARPRRSTAFRAASTSAARTRRPG